jgi:CheY-like chemotaxis protein
MEALWESHLQGKGLTLSIHVDPGVAPVLRTDATRVRQILFNLVSNAAKFTERGGVAVAVTQRDLSGDELELKIAVTDTGIGVPPENQSRLFTKFSQADGSVTRKYGGTGLGLAISKELVHLLGGEIGVDSTPGQGSTFWFTVRCVPGNLSAIGSEGQNDEPADADVAWTGLGLRILVAEDNHVNQVVLKSMLKKTSHMVDMVSNGTEAVSAVMRAPYDLVLMDVHMPEMDGVTATGRIRALPGIAGQTPIIALTANAMKGDREKYIEAGMTDYVSKPINPHLLFTAIANCVGSTVPDVPPEFEILELDTEKDSVQENDPEALRDLMADLDDLIKEA